MKQLTDVLDSYVNKNFDKAKEVWEKDEQVDDLTYIAMESVIDFLSKDKKNLDFSKKADIYFRFKRLTDENQMGNLFKVMFVTKKDNNFKTGFNDIKI